MEQVIGVAVKLTMVTMLERGFLWSKTRRAEVPTHGEWRRGDAGVMERSSPDLEVEPTHLSLILLGQRLVRPGDNFWPVAGKIETWQPMSRF